MIEEEGLLANAAKMGEFFLKEMLLLRDEFEVVRNVRGKGLMLIVELVKNKVHMHVHVHIHVCVYLHSYGQLGKFAHALVGKINV